MNFSEQYILNQLGGNRLVLQTLDAQIFYEKIGYSPCPPVQYTKFRNTKSDIFLRMNAFSKHFDKPTDTVVKIDGENRYWLHKMLK